MVSLRPYQVEAKKRIFEEWDNGVRKTLLVLATGLGKTIIFCSVAEEIVRQGRKRVLILAHRGELLDQASDKLYKTTGLITSLEKAESSCLDNPTEVVVGSVQTLQNPKRLNKFRKDFFDLIIIDEAHHCLSDGYQRVLDHFNCAKVLGVTATPDRGDKRNLGQYFETIAFEYSIAQGIKDGYLSPIRALTIPLSIDLSNVSQSAGDFALGDLGSALDPYLDQIADKLIEHCSDRKTIVFLPLIATSQKFQKILESKGMPAIEINGSDSQEIRKSKLKNFENGTYKVLLNSMLLTEGFDCPAIDCVVCLRPTKVRSLYTQIIGRGTRIAPGKDYCLILDFLWHSEKMELCHPAHLITDDPVKQKKMTEIMEEAAEAEEWGELFDLEELEVKADNAIVKEREESLAKQLKEMAKRRQKFVDPLQWEMSISTNDLASYEECMPWELKPMSDKQKKALEKAGINPDGVDTYGKANLILDKLQKRRDAGLATPKQIRFLERKGFQKVGQWDFADAKAAIDQIAGNNWRIPQHMQPAAFYNPKKRKEKEPSNPWSGVSW